MWKGLFPAALLAAGAGLAGSAQSHEGTYGPIGCEGAPHDAILYPPEPVGSWVLVFCSSGGHVLAPIPGDVWLLIDDNRATVVAAAEPAPATGAADNRHASYFTEMTTRALRGDERNDAVRMLMQELDDQLLMPYGVQLLTLRSNRDETRRVYFYLKEGQPVLAFVCFGDCSDNIVFGIDHAIVD